MPTTIRLQRTGRKKQAHFRIVVSSSAEARGGPAIETIGYYNPRTRPSVIRLDPRAALDWLHEGAKPTDTVVSILKQAGVWEKFHAGVTSDAVEEEIIELGPPPGERRTSRRSEIAAEARKAAEKRRAEEKAAGEAAARKAEAEAKAKAEAEAEAKAQAEAAEDVEPAEAEAEEPSAEVETAEAPSSEVEEDAAAEAEEDAPAAEAEEDAPSAEAEEQSGEEPADEEEKK
jgi:small subunit ribosomal protein S16